MAFRLDRRTFVKGLGASMALPLLDAMQPAGVLSRSALYGAETAAVTPPVRMAFIFFPNGCIKPSWTPSETGENFKLSETLEPLAPFQSQLNVFTGLAQDGGRDKGDGAGDHARSAASFLTGTHPVKTAGADIRAGVSVDQVAAAHVGNRTVLPSLELGIEGGRNAGSCDSGYSCAYSSNVSWKGPSTPVAKEINPRLVFERLFGNGEKDRGQRDFFRQSVLDVVAEDAARLQKKLGQTDRRKIDEYFTSVRELEQRIQRSKAQSELPRPDFAVPAGIPDDLREHIRMQYDLLALAFQTDITRISTYMLANEGSNRSYTMVDVPEGHHELSHHGNEAAKTNQIKKIDKFLITEFAYFLGKLKSIPEGEGNLLDNSMILYGSGLGDGNAHSHDDLPCLVVGGAGGRIRTGRHVKYDVETPMNNLFLSMLDVIGAKVDSIGDSKGRLSEFLA